MRPLMDLCCEQANSACLAPDFFWSGLAPALSHSHRAPPSSVPVMDDDDDDNDDNDVCQTPAMVL